MLHVISAAGPEGLESEHQGGHAALLACGTLIRKTAGRRHSVVLLAGSRGGRKAAALGLPVTIRIAPPAGKPSLAAWGVARMVSASGPPDIVMCWGAEATRLMDRVSFRRGRRFDLDLVEGLLYGGDGGVPLRLTPRLRATPRAGRPAERDRLRTELGLAPGDPALALIGTCAPGAVDHSLILGILNVGDVGCVGLAERGTPELERALRHVREGGYIRRLLLVDGPIERWYGACDAGVFSPGAQPADFGGRLAVAQALNRRLPVVAPCTPELEPLFPGVLRECLGRGHLSADLTRTAFKLLSTPDALEPVRQFLAGPLPREGPPLWRQIESAWSRAGAPA